MNVKILTQPSHSLSSFHRHSRKFSEKFISTKTNLRISTIKNSGFSASRSIASGHVMVSDRRFPSSEGENDDEAETRLLGEIPENKRELFEIDGLWAQMADIFKFSGPAAGLWICSPLMSLIDTAVIGQGSSIELAALGPGTVICDYTSYLFMFLSIATTNMIATSLAKQDDNQVQHQISILLFIAFAGANNLEIINAANNYIQIRGLAWPAMLIGWVAQSASLGMKDSWGPVKALAVAGAINGTGDIVLCRFLGLGISGAAWATMVSQIVAAYMMVGALKNKGYNAFTISIPSSMEFLQIFMLAAPAFLTIMSKTVFYGLLVYFATLMGTKTAAAHQVMIQLYWICAVWGEPLSQTAQSFMPEMMYGPNRSLAKVRTLLKSLIIIGTLNGLVLGSIGASLPLILPKIFSSDPEVIQEMQKVLLPFFIALCLVPPISCLEGTLLARQDLKFMSISMSGIACLGALLLQILTRKGFGLIGCWLGLVAFQCTLFSVLWRRLILSK